MLMRIRALCHASAQCRYAAYELLPMPFERYAAISATPAAMLRAAPMPCRRLYRCRDAIHAATIDYVAMPDARQRLRARLCRAPYDAAAFCALLPRRRSMRATPPRSAR